MILAGSGPHFSAGHDLRPAGKNAAGVDFAPIGSWGGFAEPNAHGRFAREQEIYLQITRRWRNLAKPTIAEVHGKCIAGGLMLAWACDLIVASDDAEFCDPVVTMGVCGVEWFVHPWELGPRKAKELLFTSDAWSADGTGAEDRRQTLVRAETDEGSGQPLGRRHGTARGDRPGVRAAPALPCA
jgi:enoyl-CoA hydratase